MSWEEIADGWPRCFATCVILPDPDVVTPGFEGFQDALAPLRAEEGPSEGGPPPRVVHEWREVCEDGRLCAWSDGACRMQEDPAERRAVWGLVYGAAHPWDAQRHLCEL